MTIRFGTYAAMVAATCLLAPSAHASLGFGSRNTQDSDSTPDLSSVAGDPATAQTPVQVTAPSAEAAPPAPRTRSAPQPPRSEDTQWVHVTFDKAENELLHLFGNDLPKLEKAASGSVAVYEVRVSGRLPRDYGAHFRGKLERTLLTAKSLTVKECPGCDQARLVRTESGELHYESHSTDTARAAATATELGLEHLMTAELAYTPEDLVLRVRMIEPSTGAIEWTKEYSTSDVLSEEEQILQTDGEPGSESLGQGDSFARLMIGEIAFSTTLSFGVTDLPTIGGTSTLMYPAVDLSIGERFDHGHKRFGFVVGAAFSAGGGATDGSTPIPFLLRVGPQFKYTFNPYNVTTARWSVTSELGGVIGSGLTTGYLAVGPDMTMINRFSVSLMPMYILPANVAGATVMQQNADGSFQNEPGSSEGKFGGLAVMAKVNINW